jgi:hypothetical protein
VRLDPSVDPTRSPFRSSGEVFINQWFSYRKGLQGIKNTRCKAVRLFGQKEKIYRMAFGQYVSFFNAKAVAGQTGTVQFEKSLLEYLF